MTSGCLNTFHHKPMHSPYDASGLAIGTIVYALANLPETVWQGVDSASVSEANNGPMLQMGLDITGAHFDSDQSAEMSTPVVLNQAAA